jgi:hypothetical protein
MTGDFIGEGTFVLEPLVISPDGLWAFDIQTDVVEGKITGQTDCGNGICVFMGQGPIIGGTAIGDLFQVVGGNFIPYATMNGWVTGGTVDKTEVYESGVLTQFNYQYHYNFVGVWTNQWHTSGAVYGFNVWDGTGQQGPGGSDFTLTTSTPEPGTVMLLGSGLLALAGALRRNRNL